MAFKGVNELLIQLMKTASLGNLVNYSRVTTEKN